jgi:hypothetical protein
MLATEESIKGKSGALSLGKRAYIESVPIISPIQVEVDASAGEQIFFVNGRVPSRDNSGVTLTIHNNKTNKNFADLSNSAVLTDGSLNIIETSRNQFYDDLSGNPIITATLSQVDRNGTVQDASSGAIYVYSASNAFTTTRFKTPTKKAQFTFTGNQGVNDAKLHTQLTNVNNEEFNAFDQSTDASNVVWTLYKDASLSDVVVKSTQYTYDSSSVDISYNFSATDDYYLKVVKSCTLAFDSSGNYNDDNRKRDDASPTLDAITVSLDASTGIQTFTVNGKVPSRDNSGVTLTIHNNKTNKNFVDSSNSAVLTDGSDNIIETKKSQDYIALDADPRITATLSQLDRNGTVQDASSGAIYVYSVDVSFQAYQLKIPNAPTVEFLGNATDGGNLRTKLTDLSNNGDQFDVSGTDVRYELVDASGDALTPSVDVSYTAFNTINGIIYNYDTAQNYYLKATKYASLNDTVAGVYSADISQNQEIETAVLGPRKATTSASLDLSAIQVSVDASGVQTFYVIGSIKSLDATGATLTISDGSGNFVEENVTIDQETGKITDISGTRTYDQLSSQPKPEITATLTQPDLNGDVGFDLSVDISFTAHAFKTPEAPDASDSLSKNSVGNDGKLRANYTAASDLKAMNGYNLVSVTAQINDLSDVSGAFDEAVDANASFQVKADTNQNIDLSYGYYTVDTSYNMILKKKYALAKNVFDRYYKAKRDSTVTDLSGGVVDSTQSNTVYYMGNPEITEIDVSGGANTVTVKVDTHGADLTTKDAVTLVLVAKDGLAGYADGTNTGKMGSTVMTVNAIDVVDYNTSDLGNQEVTATFDLSSVGIDAKASSVVIVDATNSHSAVSLSNFPAVTTDSLGNDGALDAKYNASTN